MSHGKVFSTLVRNHHGIETEKQSRQTAEIQRLRKLLADHGIDLDAAAVAERS